MHQGTSARQPDAPLLRVQKFRHVQYLFTTRQYTGGAQLQTLPSCNALRPYGSLCTISNLFFLVRFHPRLAVLSRLRPRPHHCPCLPPCPPSSDSRPDWLIFWFCITYNGRWHCNMCKRNNQTVMYHCYICGDYDMCETCILSYPSSLSSPSSHLISLSSLSWSGLPPFSIYFSLTACVK